MDTLQEINGNYFQKRHRCWCCNIIRQGSKKQHILARCFWFFYVFFEKKNRSCVILNIFLIFLYGIIQISKLEGNMFFFIKAVFEWWLFEWKFYARFHICFISVDSYLFVRASVRGLSKCCQFVGTYFVGNWFLVLQCKAIQYFVKHLFGRKFV